MNSSDALHLAVNMAETIVWAVLPVLGVRLGFATVRKLKLW